MAEDAPPLSTTLLPLHADAAAFFAPPRRGGSGSGSGSGSGPPSSPMLLLAVSTYELVAEEENERRGGIHLFDACGGELTPLGGVGSGSRSSSRGSSSSSSSSDGDGDSESAAPFPGVFDIKWMLAKDEDSLPTLGVALADGSVRLMEVEVFVAEGERGGGREKKKKRAVLRETARCFPLKVEEEEKAEHEEGEEGEGAAAAFPSPTAASSSSHPLDDPGAMALFLDVDDKNDSRRLAVSFSDGRVAVLEAATTAATAGGATTGAAGAEPSSSSPSPTTRLETRALWRAHEAECWCVSFSPADADIVYTGADDCEFLAWDLREIGSGGSTLKKKPRPAWRAGSAAGSEEGRHSAGVCCISPSPNSGGGGDCLIATGSYDGRVRLWDSRRSPREPLFVCVSAAEEKGGGEEAASPPPPSSSSSSSSSAPLGGGAWRLVWHPGGEPRLLCAAMHAGFAVLRLEREEERATTRIEVERRYRGHGADPSPLNGGAATLGYGCDWALLADGDGGSRLVAATASFYDNAVHLWEPR